MKKDINGMKNDFEQHREDSGWKVEDACQSSESSRSQ
jgi:hypothetical protein